MTDMDPEQRLQHLAHDLAPTAKQHARVRTILERRLTGPAILAEAKKESAATARQKNTLWHQVEQHIASPGLASLFGRLRSFISPSSSLESSLKASILGRLVPVQVSFGERFYKWGAAFVIVILGLRASPLLFLAPQTVADSAVILLPTPAGVELSAHGLWQQVTQELELNEAVALRTAEGEATIMLHDDGNVRLAPETSIQLNDVSDQLTSVSNDSTLHLLKGTVWLQALLPDQIRGFVVSTPQGTVTVHGGSVSVRVSDSGVHVETWDRHALVSHEGKTVSLISGEYADLREGQPIVSGRVSAGAYKEPWIAKNLQKDSVHQREMAQLQQERRSAEAGILPNSPFYSVKRVAENMDVLLTLDPQARVEKRLQQAGTRLNEAAALILQGDSGSALVLDEYRQTLLDVASGTGDSMTQYLVQRAVAESASQLSAALPSDQLYVLKKTVLEAGAEVSVDATEKSDVEGVLLVDALDVLEQAIQQKNTEQIHRSLVSLAPYMASLQSGSGETLRPDVRKEALLLLSSVASALRDSTAESGSVISSDIALQFAGFLPETVETQEEAFVAGEQALPASVASLSEEQLAAIVRASLHRIFVVYTLPHSRINAILVEMKKFADSPDEGRYLRRLYREMPDNDIFRKVVRTAIQNLRVEQFIEEDVETGSGTGAQ